MVTSATIANPLQHACLLLGLPPTAVALVEGDGSPCGPKAFVMWNPPLTVTAQAQQQQQAQTAAAAAGEEAGGAGSAGGADVQDAAAAVAGGGCGDQATPGQQQTQQQQTEQQQQTQQTQQQQEGQQQEEGVLSANPHNYVVLPLSDLCESVKAVAAAAKIWPAKKTKQVGGKFVWGEKE